MVTVVRLSHHPKAYSPMLVTLAGLIAALMLVIPYISTLFGYVRSVFGL